MKIIKQISKFYLPIIGLLLLGSCSDNFLEQPVLGALGDDIVTTTEGAQKLLIGAYGALDGQQDANNALGGAAHGKRPQMTGCMAQ